MHSDPIADMLTRIRNAATAGQSRVTIKASKICEGIARVLQQEGYIAGFDRIEDACKQGVLRVELKYAMDGAPAITEIKRISKTGRRVYSPVDELPHIMNGMGIANI
ncbi:MAG: 30S ribosomal protein S8, partial [Phycisphaerae bacterium]|nr:30S ribosomal protein S8 [Phycisphaerae bacterium]